MTELYAIKCSDCNFETEVVSPATLTCTKCGCGTQIFKKTMKFKCFYGHEHVGKKSNPLCKECINVERTMYRLFEPSKHIGDEENRMPVDKKVEKTVVKTKSGLKRRK